MASSDARALKVDETQYSDGRGPCLRAARTDNVVQIDDVATAAPGDEAWRRVALTAGITATLSLPIPAGANTAAALNLYTGHRSGWHEDTLTRADALATYAGDAIILADRFTISTDLGTGPVSPSTPTATPITKRS